ncbi:metallophosphoesterase [Luteolibacter flavescens]|uniref:Metallophosphoesterase n=1 Tax=Luteolibacter flavescens TaxID=1859460 RepID=A0ABT3FUG7_9BACT|nr:metallophosphoesterase [Luteolibacter flavescens]MCW1887231.1 metallophosphoesterase [Luteolibacter flavescens]
MITRRTLLKNSALAASAFALPLQAEEKAGKKLRIGLISDVHKDLVPDADERLKAFIDKMNAESVDAVMQLGDFCTPKPANQGFLDLFHSFRGPHYHVMGNHDTDGGFTRDHTVAFWGMESRHYSFDLGGYHFIVLDANDRPADWKSGYPRSIAADQIEWLRKDLEATRLNTFVFSHQSLERPNCITNQQDVRVVLEAAKTPDGKRKVAGCFNGHWHIDHAREIGGIPYIHINSASYFYMGGVKNDSVDPELAKKFPILTVSANYEGPLYTVLEIDPAAGTFTLRGMESAWRGKSPKEIAPTRENEVGAWARPSITAGKWDLA